MKSIKKKATDSYVRASVLVNCCRKFEATDLNEKKKLEKVRGESCTQNVSKKSYYNRGYPVWKISLQMSEKNESTMDIEHPIKKYSNTFEYGKN